MARLIKPLTAVQIRNAKPRDTMYKLFDGGGLFLQVNPSGGKYWKMKYRKDDGKEGLLSFGQYPAVSLEQARRKRDEAKSQKAAGLDPQEQKRLEKAERISSARNTFEYIARAWMEVHSTKVKPPTMRNNIRIIENHILPYIGAIPIKKLKAPDFLEMLHHLENKGFLFQAKRARIMASLVMRYAVSIGLVEYDPLPALKGSIKQHTEKHRAAMLDPVGLGEILRKIDSYGGYPSTKSALQILPHVFVRPGELLSARWKDIDLETGEWRYTASKTETQHIVPLSNYVLSILKNLYTITGENKYVFKSPFNKTQKGYINLTTLYGAMLRVGITPDQTCPHGFRATARTLLEEVLGERYEFIEQQLGHNVRDPNGRAYNRTHHLVERKRMMERWSIYLVNLRNGINKIPPYNPYNSKEVQHESGYTTQQISSAQSGF